MGIEGLSIVELEVQMVKLQTRMIRVGMLKGLTHPDTVKCSQELDLVINNVQNLKLKYPAICATNTTSNNW